MKTYLAVLLLLSACGRGVDSSPEFRIDDAFASDVAAYNEEAEQRGFPRAAVTIEFGDSDNAAECRKKFVGARKIVVSPGHWNRVDPMSRRVLLFHELGHCMLQLEHSPDPLAIMYFSPSGALDKDRVDELFFGVAK